MKTKKLLFCVLLSAFCFSAFAQRKKNPYEGSRIFWDINTKTTVFASGNYARIITLQDGRLMAVAENQGGVGITFSSNKGTTWTSPQKIASPPASYHLAAPDLYQLADGTIIVGLNYRPNTPYSQDRAFGIRVIRSTDNGATWSAPIFVYDALSDFGDGCWEPAFLQLPSGELQLYFSNEGIYTTNADQNISICRSFDGGLTWGTPVIVSYRAGHRDGMPAPVLLKDSSEIVFTIEDNGWAGRTNFTATTIRSTLSDNWHSGFVGATSQKRAKIFQTEPPTNIFSAAPYLRVMPNGETVASYMGNENRSNGDLQYNDMYVLVGDSKAKNFKAKTCPFSVEQTHHSIWNSVSVIDTGIVLAVGSIGLANKGNSVQIIKGYPIRQATAKFGTIIVDGAKDSGVQWTAPNAAQLIFGNITKNRAIVDFLYDNQYLYLTALVIDRNIINTGTDNDGARFLIDAANVSADKPDVGMFAFFFDTNGTVKFQRAGTNIWINDNNVSDILYSVNCQTNNYYIEAAIPWSLIGHSAPNFSNRMAIAVEIQHKEQYTMTLEGIADVDKNASWTWLNFRLAPNPNASVQQTNANDDDVKIVKKNAELEVISPFPIQEFSLFSIDGKLLISSKATSQNFKIPLSNKQEGGILMLLLEGGKVISKKI